MTAAAARKLQKEIENVLKKVDDGIMEFDDSWEQATTSANSQQKERLGEELKKSINKLQRLRVQMREWISQSAVPQSLKDKLEDSRRKIEHDMQRFKEFERDLKTKAFSTCALAKSDEFELEEAEKMKYQEWLTQTIQDLNDHLDSVEADLELLGNKKSLSNDDKSRSTQLKTFQERHRWHIKKLELVLRAVDNDALELSDLAVLRESVDYYVESHQEEDFYNDEGLYTDLDQILIDFEMAVQVPKSPAEGLKDPLVETPTAHSEEPVKKGKDKDKKKTDRKDKKKEEKDKKAGGATTSNSNSGGGSTKAAGSPQIVDSIKSKADLPLLDQLDLDEVKVQEDQLLSEAEEFICKICQIHVVGCCPKLTSCSHLFCGDCIAQWFAQHPESQTWAQRAKAAGPERVVPCPVCKQPLNEKHDMYPVCGVTSRSENLLLWRMLSSLKIMCANHPKANPEGKCEWIGEYGSYQKHIKVCKNVPGDTPLSLTSEAPAQRLPTSISLEPENDGAGESSTEASRLNTSCLNTPITVASANPAARVSPLPSPVLESHQAPRSDMVAAPITPASEARSPVSSQPVSQGRPSPVSASVPSTTDVSRAEPSRGAAPAYPSPTSFAQSDRNLWAGEQAVAKQAVPESRSPTAEVSRSAMITPAVPAPTSAPVVNRTKAEPESEHIVVAAPAKAGPAVPHEPKIANVGAQRQPHEDHKAVTPASPQEANVVKAASSFEPTGTNMVQVQVGDRIQVLEQHSSGWTYCKNLSSGASSNTGWVPSWISQAAPAPEPRPQVKPKATVTTPAAPAPVAAPVVSGPASQPSHKASQGVAAVVQPASAAPTAEARTFIRATAPFSAATASQLSLAPADLVDIVERHASGWTYGRKVIDSPSADERLEGWFPDWVVGQTK